MGKQRGYRKIQAAPKKSEKKEVKSSKLPPNFQVGPNIKNIEHLIEEEIEFAFWRKKLNKSFRKELERYPLLARAVYIGCEKAVAELIEVGENVNERILDGSTPLMIAVERGHITILQKLLKAGADLRLARNNGMNALMLAVSNNDNKVFSLLWDHLDKNDIWIMNQENSDGYTILTIAVERGYVEYVKFFSGLSVMKVDHQTGEGKSALMLAAMRSQPEIIKCLLERGASVLLEDMVGTTVLCVAFVQEQPEIIEMLLESLNKKDRDIYVKKRLELLYRPRACSSFEITSFYKEILFRVVLAIKRLLENGVELLIKYKIFFPLLKCIEMNKIDSELVWQAFHLAACLMYDSIPNDTPVIKTMAELYTEAKGLDLSLEMFSSFKNDSNVKDAAFLPLQACCIECCHGRLWLKENLGKIRKHVNEFKSNLPMLKFWLQDEAVKAEVIFDRFEMTIKNLITEKEDLIVHQATTATYNDSLDSFGSESESVDDSFESTPIPADMKPPRRASFVPLSSVNVQLKRKSEISRKIKSIKFHTKFEIKSKKSTASQKINVNFPIEVFQNSSKRLNLPALNSQTGYADALKRNLNHRSESELKEELILKDSGSLLEKVHSENESSMNRIIPDILKHTSKTDCVKQMTRLSPASDINESMVNEIKSYASVVSQKNVTKSTSTPKYVEGDSMSGELKNGKSKEISNIWNKVKEPSKLFCFITKLYPSLNISDDQKFSHITDDKEFLVPKNSTLDLKTEINLNYDKEVYSKENVTFEDSAEDKIYPKSNIDFVDSHFTEDLESKAKRIDEEAENLICLFESFNTDDHISQNVAVNYSGGDMDFERCNEEKLSRNSAPKLDNDENKLKSILETGDTPQFETKQVPSNRLNKNEHIDEVHRKVPRRTYCEVVRTNIDKDSEIDKILPKDKENKSEQKFVGLGQDDASLTNSRESLELESFCKLLEMELNSERQCSNIRDSSKKLETGETASSISSEDMSDDESEELSQLRSNKPDESTYKSSFDSELAEFNLEGRENDKNRENETPPPNFKWFSKIIDELGETSAINEKATKNPDSSFNGNFGNETSNKNYKLRCLESIRQKIVTLEDLDISPITCQLKLLSLQKHLTLYERLYLYNFCKRDAQNLVLGPNQEKMDFDKLVINPEHPFVNPLKKKITVFTDSHEFPNITIKIGKKSPVRIGARHSEESNCLELFNKYSKVATVKVRKQCSDLSRLKTKSLLPRNDTEIKRKIAREEALTRRRALKSEKYFNGQRNESLHNLDSGFLPNYINCESGSMWFHALKSLQSCVPLGQFLVDSFSQEATNSSKTSNVHRLNSAAGKIVFGTKMECTLREGTFGTYTGLIVNTGTPVRIRQFGISSFITDRAALSLSKNRLLKNENLAAFHDAVINPKDFKMYLISELCEYSLPQYLKMVNTCHSYSIVPAHFFRKLFIIDLVEGVRYLHRAGIVHGHLKPSNVMVTSDYKLKLADYYLLDIAPLSWGIRILDPRILPIGAAISKFCWRPTELILAENETDAKACICAASDIQMCGMLIFYILTGGKHPFGSFERECQENIKQGQPVMGSYLEDTEARDLVCETMKRDASERPTIEVVAKHPYFWDINKRFQFLLQVGKKITLYTSRPTRAAEEFKESCIEARDWMFYVPPLITNFVTECTCTDYKDDFLHLLLFAVGLHENYDLMPPYLKSVVVMPSHYILLTFTTFFMSIFHVIRRNSVLQKQMGLQSFFNTQSH